MDGGMVIITKILHPGAIAFTMWPWIFIHPMYRTDPILLRHEGVHLAQQRRWAIYGCGAGLLAWFFLYMLALPIWINPWRRKWETEAYIAQGLDKQSIAVLLKGAPYFLK